MDDNPCMIPPGQRRFSPLTIENMEQHGATSHRVSRSPDDSPDTTKGMVGSASVAATPSSTMVEPASPVTDTLISASGSSADGSKPLIKPSPNASLLEDLELPPSAVEEPTWNGKPIPQDQVIETPADAAHKIRVEGVGDAPDSNDALVDVSNKFQGLNLSEDKNDMLRGRSDRTIVPESTPAKNALTFAGQEAFPAYADIELLSSSAMVSPFHGPLIMSGTPGTRRTSNAGSMSMRSYSVVSRMPALRRLSTAESMISGISRAPLEREISNTMASVTDVTVYSEATRMRFNEDDRLLEQFVSQNEPATFVQQPADAIPTEVEEKMKHGSYSFVCSFGWSGEEKADLEETPLSRESYIEKLDDAKDGIRFVVRAIINYQSEINSRAHHKFKTQFLAHQNQACVVVLDQLDEIETHINEVIEEIQSFGEDDSELKEELKRAYTHALPWVKRTQRLVSEAHIFYKLNYVLGRQQKTTKVKGGLATIPAGRSVPNSALDRK